MDETAASSKATDQAALLGAALAAAIGISVAEGSWEPIESIVGLVLFAVVLSFTDRRPQRSPTRRSMMQHGALLSVLGLCLSLALAWPLQEVFGVEDAEDGSTVLPLGYLPGAWAASTVAIALLLPRITGWLDGRPDEPGE